MVGGVKGMVRLGLPLQSQGPADCAPVPLWVSVTMIQDHPPTGGARLRKPANGPDREANRRRSLLVGKRRGVGQANGGYRCRRAPFSSPDPVNRLEDGRR